MSGISVGSVATDILKKFAAEAIAGKKSVRESPALDNLDMQKVLEKPEDPKNGTDNVESNSGNTNGSKNARAILKTNLEDGSGNSSSILEMTGLKNSKNVKNSTLGVSNPEFEHVDPDENLLQDLLGDKDDFVESKDLLVKKSTGMGSKH